MMITHEYLCDDNDLNGEMRDSGGKNLFTMDSNRF